MRASLTLITTAVLALTSSVAIASPVSLESSDVLAERSAALASSAEAVDARDVQDLESRRRHKKHHKKNKHPHHGNAKKGGNGVATWYTGGQMSNPACGGGTPNDNEMVGAVSQNSPFKCHDRVTLSKGGKSVTVKIVDYCESCSPTHVDLSKGAFKKLASLGVGELHGLNWSMN